MCCFTQIKLIVSNRYVITRTSYVLYYANTSVQQHVVPLKAIVLAIVKPLLIVIYTHILYREATPNRDLHTYSLS